MIGINRWHIGGEQHPHLDIYSNQEMDLNLHHNTPAREWTCILYLNDDLKGGETYIPEGKVMCHDNVQREYDADTFTSRTLSKREDCICICNWSIYNAAVAELRSTRDGWRMLGFNDIAALRAAGDDSLVTFR